MVVLDPSKKILTLVSVVDVDPEHCDEVVRLFISTTEAVMMKMDGFISSSIHRSNDGTKVINYAQWKSEEALNAARRKPSAQVYYEKIAAYAKSLTPYETKLVDCKERG
jgi:quinol monooxygenase YgiN